MSSKGPRDNVESLMARRIRKGLPAVVRPQVVEVFNFNNLEIVGGRAFLEQLALRFYDDAGHESVKEVLFVAVDLGLERILERANER